MYYSTKIKMMPGCGNSNNAQEIDQIYVAGNGWNDFYPKGQLHDYLKRTPGTICVDIYPYPELLPATSSRGEKYVRSESNDSPYDNLLRLPRV